MKFYKPVQSIKQEIQEPIRQIAIVAVTALVIAGLALFFALGKD